MVAAIAVGTTAGYGMLNLHKAPPVKEAPLVEKWSLENQTTGFANWWARIWLRTGGDETAGVSFQEVRDGVLLFVDPSCSACDQVFSTALQVREQFPVMLAVDHPPTAELESYGAYFGTAAGDGSAKVNQILTEALRDSGLSHIPFQ
jgi:hypothetical protein